MAIKRIMIKLDKKENLRRMNFSKNQFLKLSQIKQIIIKRMKTKFKR